MTDDTNNPTDQKDSQDDPKDDKVLGDIDDSGYAGGSEELPQEPLEDETANNIASDENNESEYTVTDNKENQEPEYQSSKSYSEEYGATPMSGGTESIISFLKNQRVMAVIGGLIALYVLASLFSSSDEEEEIVPVDNNVEVSMDLSEVDVIQSEPTSIFSAIDELENETSSQQDDEVDRLKTQVASLNRQTVDFRNRMEQLDSKVDKLMGAVEQSNMKLAALAEDKQLNKSKAPKETLQEYKIRAVISGRAWLEDSAGNNITVKVGDNIPTYGRVVKIKPVEGVVETSSGRVILFSYNE